MNTLPHTSNLNLRAHIAAFNPWANSLLLQCFQFFISPDATLLLLLSFFKIISNKYRQSLSHRGGINGPVPGSALILSHRWGSSRQNLEFVLIIETFLGLNFACNFSFSTRYVCTIVLFVSWENSKGGGGAQHPFNSKPEWFLLLFPGIPSWPASPAGLEDYMKRYGEGIRRVLASFGPVPEFSGESAESIVQVSLILKQCGWSGLEPLN